MNYVSDFRVGKNGMVETELDGMAQHACRLRVVTIFKNLARI